MNSAATPHKQQPQTTKEVIAANVQTYRATGGGTFRRPHRLSRRDEPLSQLSLGNILEIARQKPDATRVAGLYAWNQLGRRVKKGEKGIRILAPIIGFRRKQDDEAAASKDPAAINKTVVVGSGPLMCSM